MRIPCAGVVHTPVRVPRVWGIAPLTTGLVPGFWTESSAERDGLANVPATYTPRGSAAAERSRSSDRRPLTRVAHGTGDATAA
ncbi:hypothetical protein GCM10010449_78240 [Streptomyces rectiviolaceus]|uniref:Uncharacterized protein n=1 Tax=Streptomyces rectiviolaceus TaxID=332591 RepID=A0ABP6NGY7_9ACTN